MMFHGVEGTSVNEVSSVDTSKEWGRVSDQCWSMGQHCRSTRHPGSPRHHPQTHDVKRLVVELGQVPAAGVAGLELGWRRVRGGSSIRVGPERWQKWDFSPVAPMSLRFAWRRVVAKRWVFCPSALLVQSRGAAAGSGTTAVPPACCCCSPRLAPARRLPCRCPSGRRSLPNERGPRRGTCR